MTDTGQPTPDLEHLAALTFGRRKEQLGRDMQRARSETAERMAARGLGQSVIFQVEANRAYLDLFYKF